MADHESELARCPIFQDMSPEECRQVTSLLERQSYSAGETILREGRSIQLLWFLVSGECVVLKTSKNGQEQQLAVLEPGTVFGEMSFFHPAPHSASIRALTDVEVFKLTREAYDQLEASGSRAAHQIATGTIRVLSERLRRMDELINEFVQHNEYPNQRQEWADFRSKLYSDWVF